MCIRDSLGIIKTPDDPIISFSDDPLRMLRLCRFISTHGFSPDNDTYVAMRDNVKRIKVVSVERVRDEISKLLVGKNPSLGLRTFVESGLSSYIIPEVNALKIEVDPNHHHKDVYEHTLTVVDNVSPTLVRRLGALLHDIAKPNTKGIENGKVHFRHHEVVGAKMTKKILQNLKYDKKTIKNVASLVELHLRPHTFKMGWTDSAVRRYIVDAGEVLEDLNNLVRADDWKNQKPDLTKFMIGNSVTGKTLGIIGMGRIGRMAAKSAKAFGMKIIYYNRNKLSDDLEDGAKYFSDIKTMLPECDFLSIHTPATAETKHILNSSTISLLPKHAVVINTSRGSTIDDDALIDALENKKIYAAGLDVFNNEPNLDKRYLKLDNCFVLPHIGSATHETRLAMSMMAVDNIYCYFNKKPLISEVV